MTLPSIEDFQANRWETLTVEERLDAFNRMEIALAEQEGREACKVVQIEAEERQIDRDGNPLLRGQYDPDMKEIHIEPLLLADDQAPYQAVETYFHEARHAYQGYAIKHPEVHDDPAQVNDWQKNDSAYIGQEDIELGLAEYSHYRWQPQEADANRAARERTDELYAAMYEDESQYPAYRQQKENEMSGIREQAVNELQTSDYEQEAYLFMLSKYDAQKALATDEGMSSSPDSEAIAAEQDQNLEESASSAAESDPSRDLDEDYDYYYGHGY